MGGVEREREREKKRETGGTSVQRAREKAAGKRRTGSKSAKSLLQIPKRAERERRRESRKKERLANLQTNSK